MPHNLLYLKLNFSLHSQIHSKVNYETSGRTLERACQYAARTICTHHQMHRASFVLLAECATATPKRQQNRLQQRSSSQLEALEPRTIPRARRRVDAGCANKVHS